MTTLDNAKDILITNDIDGYSTRPSPKLYPYQWFWDSCFIAIGYSHFDIDRAKREILGILESQWANGMIPHIKFNSKTKGYFPSPDKWKIPEPKLTSGITQPPMLAIAVWEIYNKDRDKKFLRIVFEKIKKYHEYLAKYRENENLLFIDHPWESGTDDNPIYDETLRRIKITISLRYKRKDNKIIASSHRPTKEHYDRYIFLLQEFAKYKYKINIIKNRSQFIIEDVLFNSIWCEANLCMGYIAREIGEKSLQFLDWYEATKKKMREKLVDKYYFSFDVKNKTLIKKKSCASFLPLFAKISSRKEAEEILKLINDFTLKFPVCTYDPKSPEFDPKRYWRGPVWININWFLIRGLMKYGFVKKANEIKMKTINLIKKHGFYEYFNPKTGEGYGADNFSWTAALLIDLFND